MIVDIHIPCYVDQYFPGTAMNMVALLEQAGCAVHYNVDQTCCGLPAFYDGYADACKEAGTKLIKEFQNDRYVVSCGTLCVDLVRRFYPDLFHNSVLHNEYRGLRDKLYNFSEFLVNVLGRTDFGSVYAGRAVCLDACTAGRSDDGRDPTRLLLERVSGLSLVDAVPVLSCCGWSGTYASRNEERAVEAASRQLEGIRATGAGIVVSSEAGCLMHLKGVYEKTSAARAVAGTAESGPDDGLVFMHVADVLAAQQP